MATLAQTREAIDAQLVTLWGIIRDKQDAYFEQHGRYWQGLRTHTFDLSHTATVDGSAAPDNLGSKPTDQNETWEDVFPEVNISLKAVLWCDSYDGPLGKGYVVTLTVKYGGNTYTRAQNCGPEKWRTRGWERVD